jgi:HK97 family phage prohead protease
MRKNLDLPFDLKEATDAGKFSGVASVYGALDLGGDVVERGAFAKTLAERPTVPVLWQHRTDEVIGEGKLRSTQAGLSIEAELDLEDPTAAKAFRKLKRGLIKGLSIGYESVKDEVKNGVRHLQELKLWEVSVVTFPMLPAAQVTSVKSYDLDELKSALEDEEFKQQVLSLLGVEAGHKSTSSDGADGEQGKPHTALVEQLKSLIEEMTWIKK